MPTIDEIVQVAQALEKSPIAIVHDRCVAVRNRNSTCRKCVKACQVGAISVAANDIKLDPSLCMACGACASVCPTEALAPIEPTDSGLARSAAEATSAFEGHALFACARIASKKLADPRLYAEVPCLARLDESIVLSLVAHGATEVTFVDGNCETCKYHACTLQIDETVRYSNELLAAHGSAVRVCRSSSFPKGVLADSTEGLYGPTRRGFFTETAGAAKETALVAAKTTIEQELGYKPAEESIGKRLRVTADGTMPRLPMPRHDVTINSMDAIGWPVADTINTRRFGAVTIELEKCNACGMCAVFCTTGALHRDESEEVSDALRHLEFSASECVQCGLCRDVCWKGALNLSTEVSTAQIFDFEPVVFDLAYVNRPKRNPFGRR